MVAGTTRIQREIFDTDASAVSAVSGKPGSRVYTKESKMFIFNDGDALHEEKEYEDAISGLGSAVSENTGSVATLTGSLASLQQQINDVEASISTIPQGPQGPQGPAGTGGYRFTSLTPVKGHTYSYESPSANKENSFVGVPLDLLVYASDAGVSSIRITPQAFYAVHAAEPMWMGWWGTTGTNCIALYPTVTGGPDQGNSIGTATIPVGSTGIFRVVAGGQTTGWVTSAEGMPQLSNTSADFLPAPVAPSYTFVAPGVLKDSTVRFNYAFTVSGYPNGSLGIKVQPRLYGMVDTFPTMPLEGLSSTGSAETYKGELVINFSGDDSGLYFDMTNHICGDGYFFGTKAVTRATGVCGLSSFPGFNGILLDVLFVSDNGGSYAHSLNLIYCEGRIDPPNS